MSDKRGHVDKRRRNKGQKSEIPTEKKQGGRSGATKAQRDRAEPSMEAKEAGRAALARLANKSGRACPLGVQSVNSVKSKISTGRLAKGGEEKKVTNIMAVQGVYFKCPYLGADALTKEEWIARIKDFLYEQLNEDKEYYSCLMIHTLNANKNVELCIETLCTYLQNVILYPDEEKYKKIRLSNKVFREKVSPVEGAYEFLEAAGFKKERMSLNSEEEEEFFVYMGHTPDIWRLQKMIETLRDTQAISLELDRDLKVFELDEAPSTTKLPDEFYALTKEEIRREQSARTARLEEAETLRVRASRVKEPKTYRRYQYTLIRVRFPDGRCLQGTFSVRDRLGDVRRFVRQCVSKPKSSFTLAGTLGSTLSETDDRKSLEELKLVPAVILTFVPLRPLSPGTPYLAQNLL